jgi:pilus assembly protein CpaB
MGLVAAIALAAVGTIAIVAYVRGAEDRALEGEKVVQVLVVTDEVPAGTPAEDLGDRVKLERVTEKVKADGAVTTVTALKGKVASATLVPGEQVVERRFIEASAFRARGAAVAVPDGFLQTTISVSPDRAVGGILTPGSTVAVTMSFAGSAGGDDDPTTVGEDDGGDVTHVTLRKVLVTNVQADDTGARDDEEDDSSDSDATEVEPGDAPGGHFLVTLALSDVDTERLVFAAEFGTVWLSIEPNDAPIGATKLVERDNVYAG